MADNDQFLKRFLEVQSDLLAYVLCMGVEPPSAEDVLQDAAIIMMRKFDQFEAGTNFRAWAYAVVRFEVLKKREWQAKRPLALSDETLDSLEAAAAEAEPAPIELEALHHCMSRLAETARRLIRLRYELHLQAEQIAERLSRPVESIYTTLSRTRKALQDCIRQFERRQAATS